MENIDKFTIEHAQKYGFIDLEINRKIQENVYIQKRLDTFDEDEKRHNEWARQRKENPDKTTYKSGLSGVWSFDPYAPLIKPVLHDISNHTPNTLTLHNGSVQFDFNIKTGELTMTTDGDCCSGLTVAIPSLRHFEAFYDVYFK